VDKNSKRMGFKINAEKTTVVWTRKTDGGETCRFT